MKKINLKLIALSAFIMLFGVALYTAIANQATTSDAAKINDANLWPKPENPVAPGSEDSPALKVVQNFFAAYGAGDMDALKNYVADDVQWHIPGRHPLAGTKRGIDEFISFLIS